MATATAKKPSSISELSDKQIDQASSLFKLASDPSRLKVLRALNAEETNVGALCGVIGQSQPSTSHHLALLRTSGLVGSRRQGKNNFYSLLPAGKLIVRALAELTKN